MNCPYCQQEVSPQAANCPACGQPILLPGQSDRNWLVTLLLAIFLGGLGIHRFYVGKIGTGILMIITIGGFGIWYIIDIILIAMGRFTDKQGRLVIDRRI